MIPKFRSDGAVHQRQAELPLFCHLDHLPCPWSTLLNTVYAISERKAESDDAVGTLSETATRRWQRVVLALLVVVILYPVSYLVLRATGYFVHQEFSCLSCSDELMDSLKRKYPGADWIEVTSERHQIGRGRIQGPEPGMISRHLLRVFIPLRESEMLLRGYVVTTMYVVGIARDEPTAEGVFERRTLLDELLISRNDQVQ